MSEETDFVDPLLPRRKRAVDSDSLEEEDYMPEKVPRKKRKYVRKKHLAPINSASTSASESTTALPTQTLNSTATNPSLMRFDPFSFSTSTSSPLV